ncbi:MAG TPA: MASE4 domain-containing protein [Burkholderiales bacterium]|jgi:signal transduction histidine kinase|nr:MASE4 domain-containing protein [Burkholderiales bacterium]
MPDSSSDLGEDPEISGPKQDFLATLPAGRGERRLAVVVSLVSVVFFSGFAPYAKMPLGEAWAFIPLYESALVVTDLITAILLFGQYGFLRSRALLVLACAYLFTALMTVAHTLSFPGVFAPGGLLSGGAQTTAWFYVLWHAGFPLLVALYTLLPRPGQVSIGHAWDPAGRGAARRAIGGAVAAVVAMVAALALLLTAGHAWLPAIMQGQRYAPAAVFIIGSTWSFSLIALVLLWRRRPRTVLDLWLMVVMCGWLADIALSAVLNGGRFDLGFYAGRAYGLLAGSFVMMVLLINNGRLYAHLVLAHENERRALRRELQKATELRAANQALDAFSYSVSHDLRAPLRRVDGYARMLEEDYSERLGEEGRRLLNVVREGSRKMTTLIDNLLDFSRLGNAPLATRSLQLEELVHEAIEELRGDCAGRDVEFIVAELGQAQGDPALLKQALANLIGNAIKYTRKKAQARIEIGRLAQTSPEQGAGEPVYFIRDNGAGFDMRYSSKLFSVFQRLHSDHEYEGTGVGLAIVQRVISRHGGRIWAEAHLGEGAVFYFTLAGDPQAMPPAPEEAPQAEASGDSLPIRRQPG